MGIDPPSHVVKREVLDKGESERGFKAFEGDLYGVGEFLQRKRVARGWRRERGRELWDPSMGTCLQISGDALICRYLDYSTSLETSEMLSHSSTPWQEWNR